MASLGSNLVMQPADQVGILQNGGEGYAVPSSVAAVLAPLLVSSAPGNALAVGYDGLLFSAPGGVAITQSGYTFTYSGPGGALPWDDGRVSGDAGNTLTRGADLGLFVGSDAVSVAVDGYTLTHVALDGASQSWEDGRVSSDPGNAIVRGSDGGLFAPGGTSGPGVVVKVGYTCTFTSSPPVSWDDGAVSADGGNAITRGTDLGLFAPLATMVVAGNQYTITYSNGVGAPVVFDSGAVSSDAGNALSRGTDGGLYLPSDVVSVAADSYTLTHTAVNGAAQSWEDGRVSGDPGNTLVRGSDGGLFVGGGSLGGTVLEVWVDTVNGSDANTGLAPTQAIRTRSRLQAVVAASSAVHVTVYISGGFTSSWALSTVFGEQHHVSLQPWTPSGIAVWGGPTASVTLDGVRSVVMRNGSAGRLYVGCDMYAVSTLTGRIVVDAGGVFSGALSDWTIPAAGGLGDGLRVNRGGSVVNLTSATCTWSVGDSGSSQDHAIVVDPGAVLNADLGTLAVTLQSAQSAFLSVAGGGRAAVASDGLSVTSAAQDCVVFSSGGDLICHSSGPIGVSLPNGTQNRFLSAAAGSMSVAAPLVDIAASSDAAGVFNVTGPAIVQVAAGAVTNSSGSASGQSIVCENGGDIRIYGTDGSGTVLDRDVLVAALLLSGPGALAGSATARIGDTYYQAPVVAAY